jgi:hypothetical protein
MTNGFSDPPQFNALFAATYENLRRLAALVKRRRQSATLNPTALVHRMWLKISHFERIAARTRRRVKSCFWGGSEMAEIPELLGISEVTVLRDPAAKAWLAREVREI